MTRGEYGEHDQLVPATLSIAGAAGLIGFGVGALVGRDTIFPVAARSKAEVDRFWEKGCGRLPARDAERRGRHPGEGPG